MARKTIKSATPLKAVRARGLDGKFIKKKEITKEPNNHK